MDGVANAEHLVYLVVMCCHVLYFYSYILALIHQTNKKSFRKWHERKSCIFSDLCLGF